jgi:hypothetical protein
MPKSGNRPVNDNDPRLALFDENNDGKLTRDELPSVTV